jgi:alcohol dehydrogenase (cytochrome c)
VATLLLSACATHTQRADEDWPTYGGDYENRRFSEQLDITPDNVARLVPAYVVQTGVVGPFEATPIVSGGTMYVSTANDGVIAINARNGDVLWQRQPISGTFRLCCGPVNRGVAVGDGLVVIGELDGRLLALDARTGTPRWSELVGKNSDGYSITMAPLIYRDTVFIGVAGGEFGVRGSLSAYALRDGKLKWRWYATDAQHWSHGGWEHGGGAVWTTPAIDTQRNAIYVSTGNPWPDDGDLRPGNNLYTDSIVALDASTGKLKWYFQETPHDVHDLDAASPPVLFPTVDDRGRSVAAVGEVNKAGWLYILDRDTGRLIRRSQNVAAANGVPITLSRPQGGSNWSPMSIDPATGYAIVCANHHIKDQSSDESSASKPTPQTIAAHERYGVASAIDLASGRIVWQDQFDLALVGGSVSTASGLTFFGEAFGDFDAVASRTGKLLWRFQTGAGVNAAPIIYRIDGEEFVAVASGGNRQIGTPYGDSIFVFHLPH